MWRGGFSPKLGFPPREGSRLMYIYLSFLYTGPSLYFYAFLVLAIAVPELIIESRPQELFSLSDPQAYFKSRTIEGQEGAPQDPRLQDKEARDQQADHLFNLVHQPTTLSEERRNCAKNHRPLTKGQRNTRMSKEK